MGIKARAGTPVHREFAAVVPVAERFLGKEDVGRSIRPGGTNTVCERGEMQTHWS